MENNTLLTFFEVLSSKIIGCFLPKNRISTLGFLKFEHRIPTDYRDRLAKIFLNSLRFFAIVFLCLMGIVSWSQNVGTRQTSSLKTAVAFTDVAAQINKVIQPWERYSQQNAIKQTFMLEATGLSSGFTAVKPQTADLDQIRNGSAASPSSPGIWVNGNAGASNAHYAEGYSIPYRMVMKNLTTGSHELIIEWDITHSSKNALDYITSYDNMDNPPGSHVATFGHTQETIDPTIGLSGLVEGTPVLIPAPGSLNSPVPGVPTSSFNALPDEKKKMTIYNGTINSITYVSEGNLLAAQSATRLKITFTPTGTNTTVVIAWGGHIAAEYDWGTGNGASEVSGSPYHTRLVSLDGSGGNQDRSLAASAVVIPPPACIIDPTEKSICVGDESPTFSGPDGVSTYSWSISGNSATLANDDQQDVTVNGATAADSPYTLTLVTTNVVGVESTCTATLTVNETAAPDVTYTPPACDEANFSITVKGVTIGASYTVTKENGDAIASLSPASPYTAVSGDVDVTFSNIPAGSGYSVTVKVDGCDSSPEICPEPPPPPLLPAGKTADAVAPIEAKTEIAGFDAYPVPFKDKLTVKYNFDYKSDVKIEVFNSQGIRLLSKTDTNSYLNKEIALDLKLNRGKEQVYIVKLTTDRGSSTKKVISSR